MDRERILLKLVLDEIELGSLKLESFSDRLIIQKKVYLVQVAGLDLGYRYNWYLRGPYCPVLTQNAYLLKSEINNEGDHEEYSLTEAAKKYIIKVKEIWDQPDSIETSETEWVELLASIHYLKEVAYWPQNKDTKELIIRKLITTKPQFKEKDDLINTAWQRLEKFGLIN